VIAWFRRWREARDMPGLDDGQREQLKASVMVATAQLGHKNHAREHDAGFNYGAGRLLLGIHPATLTGASVTSRVSHRHALRAGLRCLQCSYEDGVMAAVALWEGRKKAPE
jgi:hypothetical protein